ncbi:hypothetical protein INS49_013064 [Diaporthe citri]|uniref:uncharacterized protein n=1 Tax=Diaporthe citri TaxID=83186 RepID=UPI001C80E0E1|nr:uncharacterized protein INS49_013064 [Diaporthe citri]KAG6359543.1 hypothetical protein INS49_013064 [Diaporthe citri]
MAKDKRSRSRKPSGKGSQSASRDPSPSPSSAPAPGAPTDQEEKPPADSKDDDGALPQTAETPRDDSNPQDQGVPQGSEVPVLLADNGPLSSPQIEPALGAVVEDPANDKSGGDLQSPANADQSLLGNPDDAGELSPELRRPSYNLSAELGGESMDGSEEDTQPEVENESTSRQEHPGADPGQQRPGENLGEAAGAKDARSGRTEEEFQEEVRKRLAAEERVNTLEAELKIREQRYEEAAAADRRKFQRAIQKANQAREADKMKFDEEFDNRVNESIKGFQEEMEKHANNAAKLTAIVEGGGKSAADDAARIKLENDQEEFRNAVQRELNPTVEGPPVTPRDYPRPGSARFLLAECEYLLDKSSPLYDAVRSAANHADGRGDGPSGKNKGLFDAFSLELQQMNDFLEENMDLPQGTLNEAIRDWGYAAQENTW